MTKTELKSIIRNTILEAINDFPADMERALKVSKKNGDHEQSAYYTQALKRGGSAHVGWDKFKGSWAYEQWSKKPETKELIKAIKADHDRFSYMKETTSGDMIDQQCKKCDGHTDKSKSVNELAGITPVIGQNKYDYVVTTLYKGSNSQTVKSLSPIFATDEVEAKKLATAPYNRSVVTIVSVKVTNVGSVTQADIDAYNKGVKGTYDSIRRFGTTN